MLPRAALFCCLVVLLAGGQDAPVKTLHGLNKIRVLVAVDAQTDQAGLNADRLQDDVTAAAKGAGIEVTDSDDVRENLYLDVAAQPRGRGAFEVLIQLEVHQPCTLKRDPAISINAITWKKARFLSVPDNAAERIEAAAQQMADEFVKAWKSAQ
jgi:hypothetical protein